MITWAIKTRRLQTSQWELWGRRGGLGEMRWVHSIFHCWLYRSRRGPWARTAGSLQEANMTDPSPNSCGQPAKKQGSQCYKGPEFNSANYLNGLRSRIFFRACRKEHSPPLISLCDQRQRNQLSHTGPRLLAHRHCEITKWCCFKQLNLYESKKTQQHKYSAKTS